MQIKLKSPLLTTFLDTRRGGVDIVPLLQRNKQKKMAKKIDKNIRIGVLGAGKSTAEFMSINGITNLILHFMQRPYLPR